MSDSWLGYLATEGALLCRVAAAIGLAAPLGWEREQRDRPAGLRTHLLVAASAATFIVVAESWIGRFEGDPDHLRLDPLRAIEAVAASIGFLGAGTIFRSKEGIHGLTTAASLLATAAIGVLCGTGHYVLAVGITTLVLVVLVPIHWLERRMGTSTAQDPPPIEHDDGHLQGARE